MVPRVNTGNRGGHLNKRRSGISNYIIFFFLIPGVHLNCGKSSSTTFHDPQSVSLPRLSFSQSGETVECYDYVEIAVNVDKPTARNPFTDVFVSGSFGRTDDKDKRAVEGFCDSKDGSVFRIRFMPSDPGDYVYSVSFWQDDLAKLYSGKFKALDAKRKGILAGDPAYPWHFIWKGTGEHYYLNATTAFLLMGWDDEQVIRDCITRLRELEINRLRVSLNCRTHDFWTEPIKPGRGFRAHLNPWVARWPDDVRNPGFDFARFNCPYWQKFERMLRYARERDVIISVIFGWNDSHALPVAGGANERRYFDYAVARLAGYSNVTWDLGDDVDSYRSESWTHATGTMLANLDPYHHLATSHPAVDNRHQDRTSDWFGMTSFQKWERPLHGWMLDQRRQQADSGRIIPQVDEEYGYEDHYTRWAPYRAPAASADANRRAAWEIAMAGCYQTTGETAKRGTGIGPDTGGGWVNGRGDDTMVMLKGYAHMVHFFTSFEWWKAEPHDDLVNNGAFCLAEPGRRYIVYLPHGGNVTIRLELGRYEVNWFNPQSGDYVVIPDAEGSVWASPPAPDQKDWVLTLGRKESITERRISSR